MNCFCSPWGGISCCDNIPFLEAVFASLVSTTATSAIGFTTRAPSFPLNRKDFFYKITRNNAFFYIPTQPDSYPHCKEDSNYVIPEIKLRDLVPIHLLAIYIFPGSVHMFLLQQNRQTDSGNKKISHRYMIYECRNWEQGRVVWFLGIFFPIFGTVSLQCVSTLLLIMPKIQDRSWKQQVLWYLLDLG